MTLGKIFITEHKMKKSLFESFLITIFVCIFLASCQESSTQENATPNIPTPFPILDQLPQSAEMRCEDNPQYNNNPLSLWQHVAQIPQYTSSSNPDRGSKTGSVMFCTQITILGYEWSTFEETFWLLIETKEGAQGWVSANYVNLGE